MLVIASRFLDESVAVALSGGVDSCAALASLLEVGVKPIVISYTPDTHESTDFQMARRTANNLGLRFVSASVKMTPETLSKDARRVIGLGWKSKVEVESLTPMVTIAKVARRKGVEFLFTGDQSDGFFCLSKWAAHNYDRSQGVPFHLRSRNVKDDESSARIDAIRKRYFDEDFACCAGVASVCADAGLQAVFPFRDVKIAEAFIGSVWREVNEPRIKEPIRLAWSDWFQSGIEVRPVQVNLHKGDSLFGETLSRTMMELHPGFVTPRGLYSAIARGEA